MWFMIEGDTTMKVILAQLSVSDKDWGFDA